jgi:AraC-like DNA-binding protein
MRSNNPSFRRPEHDPRARLLVDNFERYANGGSPSSVSRQTTAHSRNGARFASLNMRFALPASNDLRVEHPDIFCRPVQHAGVMSCLQLLRQTLHIKLRDFIKVSGMSRRGLHKAFLAHLGTPPGMVLRAARVNRACELLARSNCSIAVVAAHCGYRNSNSLCVAFQRDLRISPGRFRTTLARLDTVMNAVRQERHGNRRAASLHLPAAEVSTRNQLQPAYSAGPDVRMQDVFI